MAKEIRKPYFWEAMLVVIFLMSSLLFNIKVLEGDAQIPLVLSAVFAGLMGLRTGMKWTEIEEGITTGITSGLKAMIILMIIGMVIGSWIIGGVVPSMIYYGLLILKPSIFLVAVCVIASLTSLAIGSSWSTAGTIGVAAIGIGTAMGIPLPMVAGAVVSGAYFGDKMSPLSDTTNMAPAVTGAELFEHIRHMVYTTLPGWIIALILYAILGVKYASGAAETDNISTVLATLSDSFYISPILLLPAFLVILMVYFKIPAIPGLIGGMIFGCIFAVLFQGATLASVVSTLHYGFAAETGVEFVDELLSRGGLDSMMWTISLVMAALTLGGIMEKTRMLEAIVEKILTFAKSTGSLVLSTVLTAIAVNMLAADQYLSIVLTGKMYTPAFKAQNLHPKNLSRIIEDAGTMTSPLIPWNSCGAFMFATLGVSPFAYLPYAFLNLLSPVISVIYGYTGFTMEKLKPGNEPITVATTNISK